MKSNIDKQSLEDLYRLKDMVEEQIARVEEGKRVNAIFDVWENSDLMSMVYSEHKGDVSIVDDVIETLCTDILNNGHDSNVGLDYDGLSYTINNGFINEI